MGKAITLSFYPLPGLLGAGGWVKGLDKGEKGWEGVCSTTGAGCISNRTNSKVLECRVEFNPLRPFAIPRPRREGSAIISFSARCLSSLLSRYPQSVRLTELTSFADENIVFRKQSDEISMWWRRRKEFEVIGKGLCTCNR